MQIVAVRDNLHEISKPILWKNNKKNIYKMSSADIFTQQAKH